MPDIFLNTPLSPTPSIKILNYVLELKDIHDNGCVISDKIHTHVFTDTDTLKARDEACKKALVEAKRLIAIAETSPDPYVVLAGLNLYCSYHEYDPTDKNDSAIKRFYILIGLEVKSQSELPVRLEEEYYLLLRAGLKFYSVELENTDGMTYLIPCGEFINMPQSRCVDFEEFAGLENTERWI